MNNQQQNLEELLWRRQDGDLSEDELDRYEKRLDQMTSASVDEIDVALKAKEAELLEV